MTNLENFWENVKKEEFCVLGTVDGEGVAMRTVSPVYHEDAILIFTHPESDKYKQLKAHPQCCLAVGGAFMQATASFLGATMLDENEGLREVYAAKFQDAFEDVPNNGRTSEFILLKPSVVKGWGFEGEIPTGPYEYTF